MEGKKYVCNHFNSEDPAGVVVLPKVATAAPLLTGCMVGGCQLKLTENNNNRKLCRWLNGLTWGHRPRRAPLQGRPGRGSRTGGAPFGCCVKKQEKHNQYGDRHVISEALSWPDTSSVNPGTEFIYREITLGKKQPWPQCLRGSQSQDSSCRDLSHCRLCCLFTGLSWALENSQWSVMTDSTNIAVTVTVKC